LIGWRYFWGVDGIIIDRWSSILLHDVDRYLISFLYFSSVFGIIFGSSKRRSGFPYQA